MSLLAGHLTILDVALTVWLCLIFPALQLYSSLRKPTGRKRTPRARVLINVVLLGGPLAVLAAAWWINGRPLSALGLAIPVPFEGQIGLGLAVIAIVGFAAASFWFRAPAGSAKAERDRQRLADSGMLSKTPAEFSAFVLKAFAIGCGLEILFRGYLLWVLVPLIGLSGAVVVAALAYGLGHGVKNRNQAIGSVVSAFVFTIAYALTQSLWWLMLFHTFVALHGGWAGYRLARQTSGKKAQSGMASSG